jgi:DNA-binding NarL/FixJ family response regulator
MAYKVMELKIDGKVEKLINVSKMKPEDLQKLINQMGKFTSEVLSKKTDNYELSIYATSGLNKLLVNAKLSERQIANAINSVRRGYSVKAVAKQYQIAEGTLSKYIREGRDKV